MVSTKRIIAVSALSTLISSSIHAAGFYVAEHSASGMGSAFAGASAIAEDASTTYFNPAGLSKLTGQQYIFAGHYVSVSAPYTDTGSTSLTTAPLNGTNDDGATSPLIPNFYYARELNDKWTFGFGINVPFGNASEYTDGWVGRYHATKSEITTINFNPSASYKVNDDLSVGFGVNVQYIEAILANKLDSDAICNGPALAGLGGACALNNLDGTNIGNAAFDSNQSLTGDDWSLGWNVGLLYDISDSTRLGLAYRSNIEHALTGNVDFTLNSDFLAALTMAGLNNTVFIDTGVSAGVDLPETISLSITHNFDSKWTLLADATWTKWSRFDKIVIDFSNPAQTNSEIREEWDNSMRYSVGVNYKADSKWIYRAGLALDETPVPSAERMTARIPDSDRTWLSLGFGYKSSDTFSVDVGYSHLIFDDVNINNTDDSFGHTLTGSYDVSVDIFSAQFNWKY